jgi:hypothetical protein
VTHLAEYLRPLRGHQLAALVIRGPDVYRRWFPEIDEALSGVGLHRAAAYADREFEVYFLERLAGGG